MCLFFKRAEPLFADPSPAPLRTQNLNARTPANGCLSIPEHNKEYKGHLNTSGMKKYLLLIFLLLTTSTLALEKPTESWSSGISIQCQNTPCIEGQPMLWVAGIKSNQNTPFDVEGATIKSVDGIIIASDFKQQRTVKKYGEETFQLQSATPPPLSSATLFYELCFVIAGQETCESPPRSIIVLPLTEVECENNDVCSYNERCLNFKCKALSCKNIENHECIQPKTTLLRTMTTIVLLLIAVLLVILILPRLKRNKHHEKDTNKGKNE